MADSFGQKASLVPMLRGILRDYSGSQILKEMLQNADDAGATRFYVCLDKRKNAFRKDSLLSKEMKEFQGPGLYAYDDVEFKDVDYASIQRVGDGLKKGDPTKTGQFGLGFNSCYHLTDLPMFCSGPNLVLFDPHTMYLPPDGRGDRPTGRVIDMQDKGTAYGKVGEYFADVYQDQIAPFSGMFGCTGKGEWVADPVSGAPGGIGTLFRLPFRSHAVAKASKIKRGTTALDPELVQKEVLGPFIEDASSCLLFLRNVEDVKVYVWEDGQRDMELAFSAAMEGMDGVKRQERKAQLALLKGLFDREEAALKKDRSYEWSDIEADNKAVAYRRALLGMMQQPDKLIPRPLVSFRIASKWGREKYVPAGLASTILQLSPVHRPPGLPQRGVAMLVEQYVVSTGFGDHSDQSFVAETLRAGRSMTLVPYSSVAARVAISVRAPGPEQHQEVALPLRMLPLDGKVFCCLPTPIFTKLPVHIDGRWELSRDRNFLSGMGSKAQQQGQGQGKSNGGGGEGEGEDAAVRAVWNHRLAGGVAAAAYARLLRSLLSPTFALQQLSECTTSSITTDDYYSLFPSREPGDPLWSGLVEQLFMMLTDNAHPLWSLYIQRDRDDDVVCTGRTRGVPFLRTMSSVEDVRAILLGGKRLLYDHHNRWAGVEEAMFLEEGEDGSEGGAEGSSSSSSPLWSAMKRMTIGDSSVATTGAIDSKGMATAASRGRSVSNMSAPGAVGAGAGAPVPADPRPSKSKQGLFSRMSGAILGKNKNKSNLQPLPPAFAPAAERASESAITSRRSTRVPPPLPCLHPSLIPLLLVTMVLMVILQGQRGLACCRFLSDVAWALRMHPCRY